jgi:hypothetical protein
MKPNQGFFGLMAMGADKQEGAVRKWLATVGVLALLLGLIAGWLAHRAASSDLDTGALNLSRKSPEVAAQLTDTGPSPQPPGSRQTGGSIDPSNVPVAIAASPPASKFRDSDYGKTRMDIYFEFYRAASEWTADDYFRQWLTRCMSTCAPAWTRQAPPSSLNNGSRECAGNAKTTLTR